MRAFPDIALTAQLELTRRSGQSSISDSLFDFLSLHGTVTRLERRQAISGEVSGHCEVILILHGSVALQMGGNNGHVLDFCYQGEIVSWPSIVGADDLSVQATSEAEISRIRKSTLEMLAADRPALLAEVNRHGSKCLRRLLVMNARLAGLSSDERFASFLVGTALQQHSSPSGPVHIRLDASRGQIAGHLGLNPDTLGRIIAGFENSNLIAFPTRNSVLIRSWGALCAQAPLAASLIAMAQDASAHPA